MPSTCNVRVRVRVRVRVGLGLHPQGLGSGWRDWLLDRVAAREKRATIVLAYCSGERKNPTQLVARGGWLLERKEQRTRQLVYREV